ncbi:uncharacterized protein [Physcomitrium patens]|uniref:LisH domain-containing protein n=1 Tax=Physcomitrium patens TaxID=3218 RepID=A0A2K1J0C4_PHYPA|nr:uncharacterized protein LOC112295314 isoform X3 [Physcomitrium patens]PNR34971.1 hypothetical protein PHYPA_022870 [Physcomitrium patens]|eukprot:XP_024402475.1 uncharacterized protein LOC112295314 isoform X3 [Physcomitrella patens]
MEVDKPCGEFSKEELRRQLYTSLQSAGVLDSMKGQLRARLLEHLRHSNGVSIEPKKKQSKPSLTDRLLSSLFLDYLESNRFTFTISMFMPESQMASWPPFSYEEMLEQLHLDPSSDLHVRLKLQGGEERECLARQVVTLLQQLAQRSCIQDVSTQTSPAEVSNQATRTFTSPKELERSIKEVEDTYTRKREALEDQRMLPYRSLEAKINVLHQEFDARVNAEVVLQVSRIRDYEINAARMDEATRYRRQLARDREELEDIHKSRMDRVKAREESLLGRVLSKEKAIEASAYEQRQKILTEITSLRERENKLRQFKESQERRKEKLDERELLLKAKEEEVACERKSLYDQADKLATSRSKELEEQFRELCDRLHHDRNVLEAEREQMKEEKVAMAIELAATKSEKELIQALHRRLSIDEDQRLNKSKIIRELEEKVKHLEEITTQKISVVNIPDQRLEEQLQEMQVKLEQERLQREQSEKANKTLEHKLQQKEMKLQLLGAEKEKLTTRHKKLLLKINQLETLIKNAQEEKDHAIHDLEVLGNHQMSLNREVLETTTPLRKAQQALEAERLEHCALRSHVNAGIPSISVAPERQFASEAKIELNNYSFDQNLSADDDLRKKWVSSRKKPDRESHDLWTQLLSENAAKKAALDKDLDGMPVNHVPISTMSKSFSSGYNYPILEFHDHGLLKEPNYGGHKDVTLSQTVETRNQSDHDTRKLSRTRTRFSPEPSTLSTEESRWEMNDGARILDPNDMNGCRSITFKKMNAEKGGNTSATEAEVLMETGILDEFFTRSWDPEKYDESSYEDAVPSWRKTYRSDNKRYAGWNSGYEESMGNLRSVVTNLGNDTSEADIGVLSSSKALKNAWNHSHDHSPRCSDSILHWEIASHQWEEKPPAICDYQELLSGVNGFQITSGNQCVDILEKKTPNIQNIESKIFCLESKQETDNTTSHDFVNRDCVGDEDTLIVRSITVVTHTQKVNEHIKSQERGSSRSLYLGEKEENTSDNLESEEDSSRDSFSCKCMSSLKHDLESLEEISMRDDSMPQTGSHIRFDQEQPLDYAFEGLPKKLTMMPEMSSELSLSRSGEIVGNISEIINFEEDKTSQENRSTEENQGETDTTDKVQLLLNQSVSWDSLGGDELMKLSKLPLHDTHTIENSRTSIVTRKQEVLVDQESTRLTDRMSGLKNHPILALAIRNNQIVKLGPQNEFQNGEKANSIIGQSDAEVMSSNSATDEKECCYVVGPEVDEKIFIPDAPDPTHTPSSLRKPQTSSEESTYKGDSFEDEESEVDQEQAYSEESCTNMSMRMSSVQAPDVLALETNEQASLRTNTKIEGNEGSSENWEGESEQSSYSIEEDDAITDSVEWLDTHVTQETTQLMIHQVANK